MNEVQMLKNRDRVAMSSAKKMPAKEEYLIASYMQAEKPEEYFVPPIEENVVFYLQQEKNRDKEILFSNANNEALFEVHNNIIGLCVKEEGIVSFCTNVQQLLDKR